MQENKMPYLKFTKVIKGKKYYCTKNLDTNEVIKYESEEKRKHGMMMRHAIDKGFKPTGEKGTGKIKKS